MTPNGALLVCLCFVSALLVLDHRWRPKISIGGWIPLIWVLIISSRPVTSWFFPSMQVEESEALLEGSPVDRMFYLIMILAGLLVLFFRRFNWLQFVTRNKWVVLYFAYLAISALWSDYTFISFKRWIKDFGNLVMVLIVVSESDPVAAVKALLVRASYVLVPLSVVLLRYFPHLARYYDDWTGRIFYSGIGINKNMLGMTLTVLALGLVWALVDSVKESPGSRRRREVSVYVLLLVMIAWQLSLADCATASACITVGVMVLLFLRVRNVRKNIRVWLTLGILTAVLLSVVDVKSMLAPIAQLLGRDTSLTGRDDIWKALLKEDINPIIGVGAYSFWMGERVARLSAGYESAINEAHNGYLEIYLNVGLVGLALFLAIVASATRRTVRNLTRGESDKGESFRFAFLTVAVLYNSTEAVVSRLDLVWFGLLLVVLSASVQGRRDRVEARDAAMGHESFGMRGRANTLVAQGSPAAKVLTGRSTEAAAQARKARGREQA